MIVWTLSGCQSWRIIRVPDYRCGEGCHGLYKATYKMTIACSHDNDGGLWTALAAPFVSRGKWALRSLCRRFEVRYPWG